MCSNVQGRPIHEVLIQFAFEIYDKLYCKYMTNDTIYHTFTMQIVLGLYENPVY